MNVRVIAFIVLPLVFGCKPSDPATSPWRDPSPHTARMVTIAPGASVEVLDWGGQGRPLVFLAGLGDTPHVFDDMASSFTDSFHVVGITRLGFGHSIGLPDTDATALVNDLRILLDSLALSRVILVGSSLAGEELTGFGAAYPDRCEALIYLDAASDRSDSDTKLGRELQRLRRPATRRPKMTTADSASLAAVQAYFERTEAIRFPEADVRAFVRFDSAGRFAGYVGFGDSLSARRIGQLFSHLPPPAYRRLKCPSLAIYAVADSAAAHFPWYASLDSAGKADAVRYFRLLSVGLHLDREQYRQNAPSSHVVEIHNASHWIFLSHRDETLDTIRTFFRSVHQ